MEYQHRVGIDISKDSLQVCVVSDKEVINIRLSPDAAHTYLGNLPPSLIGLEACATANEWGRKLQHQGHEVRLIPPQYVKPYVLRDKTDRADAAAIAEALQHPGMRWSPPKTVAQQEALSLHRVRSLVLKTRIAYGNALRGCCAEFGISAPRGRIGADHLSSRLCALPPTARASATLIIAQMQLSMQQLKEIDLSIVRAHRQNPLSQRLTSIPGVGPITASALVSTVENPRSFPNSRAFSSWIGLTPRVRASGSRITRGGISKRGDGYLRRLLVLGAMSAIRWHVRTNQNPWLDRLLERKNKRVAAVALANRNARIAWALMAHGGIYNDDVT